MTTNKPTKWCLIRVSQELRQQIQDVQAAWNGVGSRRLSQQNVIEIVFKHVAGKLTQEQVDATEVSTRPPGRPYKRKRAFWPDASDRAHVPDPGSASEYTRLMDGVLNAEEDRADERGS